MKTLHTLIAILFALPLSMHAQSWSTSGNAGLTTANFLGTTDSKALIFKTKGLERGRVFTTGTWRFGFSATNNAQIDSSGKLSFNGSGGYLVGDNRYMFHYTGDTIKGLFLNVTQNQYQFLNHSKASLLFINADNGNSGVLGTFKVGAYTFPKTDGTNGQVLKTNGSGVLTWSNDNAGSGWLLTGNAGTNPATNFIGTTDSKGFAIRTNNVDRMRIGFDGNIGMGTTTPVTTLQVIGTSFVTLSDPGYMVLGNTAGYNLGMDFQQIQSRNNGSASTLFLNSNGGTTQVGNSSSSFQGVLAAGSSYGVYAYAPTGTGVYGQGGNYGGFFENFNGIGVYGVDRGNGQGVFGYETGSGEGTHGVAYGLAGWGAYGYSSQSFGVFGITDNASSYAGYFSGNVYTTGSYLPSDQKLKQNIQDFTSAMSVINQLHPKQYQYRQDGNYKLMNLPQGLHYGLIAQEVEKILPGLLKETKFDVDRVVTSSSKSLDPKNPNAQTKNAVAKTGEVIDFKAINYTELIPIMIKGMQEQQEIIDRQQKEINAQQQKNKELENGLKKLEGMMNLKQSANKTTISLSTSSLEQNIPNPFNHTTIINYTLPQTYSSAKIIITDKGGKTLKEVNVSGSGKGSLQIDASTLSNGAYQYSLYVDGKLIDTKQMILAK
ncbi:MAG: tail fiber domain-containing protein [Parafilimonas sp.]